MCGIAGIVAPRATDPSVLGAMGDALHHRGPDGEGYCLLEADVLRPAGRFELGSARAMTAGLAHRRLTIIDLSQASAQPMFDETGDVALAYNGEVYNYVELRRQLEGLGHRFSSHGDTEVVLRAYLQWGADCVQSFVGMWAFAILDRRRRALVLSRDRFGIKPLYVTRSGGVLRFASEIKGLLADRTLAAEPDESTVAAFLLRGSVDVGERTFFAGIEQLLPAHTVTVPLDDPARMATQRYWEVPPEPQGSAHEAVSRYAELFTDAVRLHMRSDVPLGTCLSGGIDSSAIVCTADRLRRSGSLPPTYTHRAFGYVPPDGRFSERSWMEMVADHAAVDLTVTAPDAARFEGALGTIVDGQDEPFGSASIAAQWFVFDAARRAGIKVMLDGQGADEVLGGYHSYLVTVAAALLNQGRAREYLRLHAAYRRRLGAHPLPPDAVASALLPPRALAALRRLLPAASAGGGPPVGIESVVTDALAAAARPAEPLPGDFHGLLKQQTEGGNLPALLRYEDRNSMIHSIEARVPFLDHRLVELAFSLPPDEKVRGAETKRILRRAMHGVLPEPVRRRRDKIGFRADASATARYAQRHRAELLRQGGAPEERWFRPDAVALFLDAAHRDPALEFALWRVINVKLWARAHWGGEWVAPAEAKM